MIERKKKGAAYEHIKSDCPTICNNVAAMYRKIMSQSNEVWNAEQYGEELKKEMTGFDYRIRRDDTNEAIAIMWITPYSRKVLRRYPEILSLDMQGKQYNVHNWPYCSLVFHGGENRGEQGCECIVCKESIDMYHWILTTCAEMEPGFSLSNIRVIFADNAITDELLKKLGIENTCFLHCDYYHQMLLVWPKLLDSKFHPIEQYLCLILKSETEEQFISACDKVYQILSKYDNGLAATFVNDIKTRYKYYGGFYLHVVTGLMNMIGSHEVEQNHARTHAYLGNSDHLPIVTQT